jgi:hypothetical protein
VREIVSKLIAGGLSAAVVLLWWPVFFPADTVESWLIRGVVWTLTFELLVLTLLPLERALWDTAPARRAHGKARDLSTRVTTAAPRVRRLRLAAPALLAVSVPVALLLSGPAERLGSALPAATKVTEVKRIVKVEKRIKVVPVERAAATSSTGGYNPGVPQLAPRRHAAATRPAPRRRAATPRTAPPHRTATPAPPASGVAAPPASPSPAPAPAAAE